MWPKLKSFISGSAASPTKNNNKRQLEALLKELSLPADAIHIPQRIELINKALALVEKDKEPHIWGNLQMGLARIAEVNPANDQAEKIEKALAHLQLALEGYTRAKFPTQWAAIQSELAVFYTDRVAGDLAENAEKAIQHNLSALEVFTRSASEQQWALVQYNLGRAYMLRFEGKRKQNLVEAVQHFELSLQVFKAPKYSQQASMVQNNLSYVRRKAPLLNPARPGHVSSQALQDWQTKAQEEHEAKEEQSPVHPIITSANAHLLQERMSHVWRDLQIIEIHSSRWVVLRTAREWRFVDVKANRLVLSHRGPEAWLEMVNLGPYAALAVKDGVIQTEPLPTIAYEYATLWQYDSDGDSVGIQYNLSTGESVNVFSQRMDMSDEVWVWKRIVLMGSQGGWPQSVLDIDSLELEALSDGRLRILQRDDHQELGKLQAATTGPFVVALTPDRRTLLTASQTGEFKVWQIAN